MRNHIVLPLLSVFSSYALADESNFNFSAFGTLAYTYENEKDVSFIRDGSFAGHPGKPKPGTQGPTIQDLNGTQRVPNPGEQPPKSKKPQNGSFASDSQLGIQLSYQFNQKWSAVVQAIYADKVNYNFDSAIEWAFAKYSPNESFDIRAGRLGFDVFMLSDTRRIDYAHLLVRQPQEVYGWIVPYTREGVDFTYKWFGDDIYYKAALQFGEGDFDLQHSDSFATASNKFDNYFGFTFTAEDIFWQARASYVSLSTDINDQDQNLLLEQLNRVANAPSLPGNIQDEAAFFASHIDPNNISIDYYQAGIQYDDGQWVANAEVIHVDSSSRLALNGTGGYVTLGYHLGDFTPYINMAAFNSSDDILTPEEDWSYIRPHGPALQGISVEAINRSRIEQQTFSLGVRWDFMPQWALKAQWDNTDASEYGGRMWSYSPDSDFPQAGGNIDLYTVSISFVY